MPDNPLPRFGPTPPPARHQNALIEAIARMSEITGIGGLTVAPLPGGRAVGLEPTGPVYARIVGGTNPYAWNFVARDGTWQDVAPGGTTLEMAAYEVNGAADVPAGKVVELYPGAGGDWRFQYRRSGLPPQCVAPCAACESGEMPVRLMVYEDPEEEFPPSYELSHSGGAWAMASLAHATRWIADPVRDAPSVAPSDGGCDPTTYELRYRYDVACEEDGEGPYVRVTRTWGVAWAYPKLSGTLAVENGSDQVVGTGTAFLSEVVAGAHYAIGPGPNSREAASVEDDAHLTLAAPYPGATASGLSGWSLDEGVLPCDGTGGLGTAYRSLDAPCPPGGCFTRSASHVIRAPVDCGVMPSAEDPSPGFWEGSLTPDGDYDDPVAAPVRVGGGIPPMRPSERACRPRCMPCGAVEMPTHFAIGDAVGTCAWLSETWSSSGGSEVVWVAQCNRPGVPTVECSTDGFSEPCACDPEPCPPYGPAAWYSYAIRCRKDYSGKLTVERWFAVAGTPWTFVCEEVAYGSAINANADALATTRDRSTADLSGEDPTAASWTATPSGSTHPDPVGGAITITRPPDHPSPPGLLCGVVATRLRDSTNWVDWLGVNHVQFGSPYYAAAERPEVRIYGSEGGELLFSGRVDPLGNMPFEVPAQEDDYWIEADAPNDRWQAFAGPLTVTDAPYSVFPDSVDTHQAAYATSYVTHEVAPGYVFVPFLRAWRGCGEGGYANRICLARNQHSAFPEDMNLTTPAGDVPLAWNPGGCLAWVGAQTLQTPYRIALRRYEGAICTEEFEELGQCLCCAYGEDDGIQVGYTWLPTEGPTVPVGGTFPGGLRLHWGTIPLAFQCGYPDPPGRWLGVYLETGPGLPPRWRADAAGWPYECRNNTRPSSTFALRARPLCEPSPFGEDCGIPDPPCGECGDVTFEPAFVQTYRVPACPDAVYGSIENVIGQYVVTE